MNDQKISAIGRYIRYKLAEKVKAKTGYDDLTTLFGWEIAHRDDKHRKRRKIEQLIVDEITFVLSGLIALVAFWFLVPEPPAGVMLVFWFEVLLLIVVGIEIAVYADLAKGR